MADPSEEYSTIRQILGELIGKRIVDITQHDWEEWKEGCEAYVMLMFDDGSYLKFPVTEDGFEHNCETVLIE